MAIQIGIEISLSRIDYSQMVLNMDIWGLYLVPSTWYQVLGTKYLLPSTWYQVLGTKYLVPSTWYQVLGTTLIMLRMLPRSFLAWL